MKSQKYPAAATTAPTPGESTYTSSHLPASPQWWETSAGPNARAGLSEPPVSGARIITEKPSVPPITSPDQSLRPVGLTATATTASTRKSVPMPSAPIPPSVVPTRESWSPGAP